MKLFLATSLAARVCVLPSSSYWTRAEERTSKRYYAAHDSAFNVLASRSHFLVSFASSIWCQLWYVRTHSVRSESRKKKEELPFHLIPSLNCVCMCANCMCSSSWMSLFARTIESGCAAKFRKWRNQHSLRDSISWSDSVILSTLCIFSSLPFTE